MAPLLGRSSGRKLCISLGHVIRMREQDSRAFPRVTCPVVWFHLIIPPPPSVEFLTFVRKMCAWFFFVPAVRIKCRCCWSVRDYNCKQQPTHTEHTACTTRTSCSRTPPGMVSYVSHLKRNVKKNSAELSPIIAQTSLLARQWYIHVHTYSLAHTYTHTYTYICLRCSFLNNNIISRLYI